MKQALAALALLCLCACEPEATQATIIQTNNRVTFTRIAVVEDETAYNQKRGIYLINDSVTKTEYIGVSGIGIQEIGSHQAGKNNRVTDER